MDRYGMDVIPSERDIVIAVMGITGSGKTSFIQNFCSQKLNIGHDLESCTNAVQIVRCHLPDGTKIFLIDTPGFDDTYRSDTDVLRELADWLSQAYEHKILLSGIVYMHRITDVRVGGSGMKNLRMFRKLCGVDGLGGVACVTSMWSLCSPEDGGRRERQLTEKNDLWKSLLNHGARAFRHDVGKESALGILTYLINRRRSVTLDIQVEMVDKKLNLSQTAAGKEVQGDIEKLKEEHDQEMKDIRDEMEEAIREKDDERRQELESYQRQIREQMQKQEEELRRLEASKEQLRREMREEHSRELADMRSRWDSMQRGSTRDDFEPRVQYQPYYILVEREERGGCVIL